MSLTRIDRLLGNVPVILLTKVDDDVGEKLHFWSEFFGRDDLYVKRGEEHEFCKAGEFWGGKRQIEEDGKGGSAVLI